MLIFSMAFPVCKAQNILVNPDFTDVFKCCEYNVLHITGWFYAGYPNALVKKEGINYLKIPLYNDSNEYYSITLGSLVKPLKKGHKYKIRMSFDRKEIFYLHYGTFRNFIIRNEDDTIALSSVNFSKALVRNKAQITIDYISDVDSADYIAFKFQSFQNIDFTTGSLHIDYIELIDPTENKDVFNRHYGRIKEIYSGKRMHDFTKPCGADKTLNRN